MNETTTGLRDDDCDRIQAAIEKRRTQFEELDMDLINEVVGVRQAADSLAKALDQVNECLDRRDYHAAADLGYSDVSSNYVFLQRTLGGLKMAAYQQNSIISEVAGDTRLAYEVVEPFALAFIESLHRSSTATND